MSKKELEMFVRWALRWTKYSSSPSQDGISYQLNKAIRNIRLLGS